MDNTTFIIIVIAAIFQIIIIVVFFGLASNVNKIVNLLPKKTSYKDLLAQADEEKFIGNKVGYKECLLRAEFKINQLLDKLPEKGPNIDDRRKFLIKQVEMIESKLSESI